MNEMGGMGGGADDKDDGVADGSEVGQNRQVVWWQGQQVGLMDESDRERQMEVQMAKVVVLMVWREQNRWVIQWLVWW